MMAEVETPAFRRSEAMGSTPQEQRGTHRPRTAARRHTAAVPQVDSVEDDRKAWIQVVGRGRAWKPTTSISPATSHGHASIRAADVASRNDCSGS